MRRLLLLVLVLSALSACGARWRSAEPRMMHLGGPVLAYEATLVTLQGEGYLIARSDPHRGSILAQSKVDQKGRHYGTDRVSWIAFQAYRDGSLVITANGFHVKRDEGVMHRKLAEEIEGLRHGIYRQARAMYDASTQPATASPAPAPSH